MIETPQEYTERILGYLKGSAPMSILASTPAKLEKLLRGVPRQKLGKRPESDRWSVAEILAHLADSELVMGFRIRLVLGSNGVTTQAFDQDAWAEYSNYRRQDPKISYEAFRAQRVRNIRLLRQIPPAMWENFGMHTERGRETVTRLVEMLAGHDVNHVGQIEKILHPPTEKKRRPKT